MNSFRDFVFARSRHLQGADLSFLFLSIYALILTAARTGDSRPVAHEGNDGQ
jgi:hypothetical protein